MAARRMFCVDIGDSDDFLELPPLTQNLYFHICLRADDDGVTNKVKKIMRLLGATEENLDALIRGGFLLPFPDAMVVAHWKIHNYIQKDRYKPTMYQNIMETLDIAPNGLYVRREAASDPCIQTVSNLDTQVRLGEVRLGEESQGEPSQEKKSQAKDIFSYKIRSENHLKKSASDPIVDVGYGIKMLRSQKKQLLAKMSPENFRLCVEELWHKQFERFSKEDAYTALLIIHEEKRLLGKMD